MTSPTSNTPTPTSQTPTTPSHSESCIPVDELNIPNEWDVEAVDEHETSEGDVLITGPREGQYISITVKPGNRVHIRYVPSGYDKTRIVNPSYSAFRTTLDAGVEIVNRFFETRDPDTVFNADIEQEL